MEVYFLFGVVVYGEDVLKYFLFLFYNKWMNDLGEIWCIIKWLGYFNCDRFMFLLNNKDSSLNFLCV